MNNVFAAKLLQNLRNKKGNKGFTLIELLVVVIIVGVLAAVALPNLLGQVGKARETEAKTTVGSVNKAQQAFHFERQVFANGTDITVATNPLGVVIPATSIYDYTITGNAGTDADVLAEDTAAIDNGTRNYAAAITYAAGAYETIVCQTDSIGGTATAAGGACGADMAEIK